MSWNPLNFFTSNPIGGAATSIFAAFDRAVNFRKAEEMNAENERQIREIMSGRITRGVGDAATFGRLQTGEARRVRGNIDRAMASLRDRGMNLINRVGDQQRADVRQTFGNQFSAAEAQTAGAGLSGTPLSAGMRSGFATAETNAQRRLEEQLTTQKFNAFTGLEGNRISALQANENNVLDTRERGFNQMLQTYLSTTGDAANFINSINVPHPDNNNLVQRLSAASVDPPKRSSRELWYPMGVNMVSDVMSAPGEMIGSFGRGVGG